MIELNEYFNGNVKSLSYHNGIGKSTVGVMNEGVYTFKTGNAEIMTVVEGHLEVKLPNENDFRSYKNGDQFEVPANSSFEVKSNGQTSYCCQFI